MGAQSQRFKVSRADIAVKRLLAATFPEWKGRKVMVVLVSTYHMADYWDGGSRNEVKAVHLESGIVRNPSELAQNPIHGQAHATIAIPPGVVLVEHSIFCGKDAGVTIYVSPTDQASYYKLLPGSAIRVLHGLTANGSNGSTDLDVA